jgi:histidinol-phosphate aminotransferase
MTLPLRDDLVGQVPYESFDQSGFVRLATNENGYEIPETIADEVAEEVKKVITGANRYPDEQMIEVKSLALDYLHSLYDIQLKPENLVFGNGSTELFLHIFNTFGGPSFTTKPRSFMTFSPTYVAYDQDARDSKTTFVKVPRDQNFAIDLDLARREIARVGPALIIITNPNNPTGNLTPKSDLIDLLKMARSALVSGTKFEAHPIVMVDEAYIDFVDSAKSSVIDLINDFDNLLVMRTFSKNFGLAGLRFGFAIAQQPIIDAIRIVKPAYNISMVVQAAAKVAFKRWEILTQHAEQLNRNRIELVNWLNQQTYQNTKLRITPSQTNFIHLGFSPDLPDYLELPQKAIQFLYERKVIVRGVGAPGYFRISIGSETEIELLKKAFSEFLDSSS